MTKEEEIKFIEYRLKTIFSQDVVRAIDVVDSNKLLDKWKVLTGYVSDKTPVLQYTPDFIEPILEKNHHGRKIRII
jgi:hypothetical protein